MSESPLALFRLSAPLDRVSGRFVAVALAALYVVLSVAYILASTHVAAVAAQSVEQLGRLERIKGVVFVVGSGVLFFVIANYFLTRLQAQRDALLASEHRTLAGLFASSIAHDINNLTMVARGSAEILLGSAAGAQTREAMAANLRDSLERLSALSQRLMTLGRVGVPGEVQDRDLVAAVERALSLARRHERVRRCRVSTSLGSALVMPIDEILVDRMLLNLVLNAADATKGSGRIDVRIHHDDDRAVLEVHDDGSGVSDQDKDAIFEAFHTSKPSGLGLGLVSVRACVEVHGGTIEVLRSDLGGACFRVTLPRRRRTS